MLDIQTSYIRLLIGDNDRAAPFYTDAQIQAAATVGAVRPALPIDLRVAGAVGFIHYPEVHGTPVPPTPPGGPLSLAILTDAQLAALTDAQLASMVN
jgi:hypothetical protein